MARKVRSGREWSPRGTAVVWMVLRTGDWGTSWDIYGSEELAWAAVKKFIEAKLRTKIEWPIPEEARARIEQALEAEDVYSAYDIFSQVMSDWGNDFGVHKVLVKH